jgi:hypothetical protein
VAKLMMVNFREGENEVGRKIEFKIKKINEGMF